MEVIPRVLAENSGVKPKEVNRGFEKRGVYPANFSNLSLLVDHG